MTDEQKRKVQYFVVEHYLYVDVPESSVTPDDDVVTDVEYTNRNAQQDGGNS